MDDYCGLCDREFPSEHSLYQHLRDSRLHRYDCIPCRRHFRSEAARRQHCRDSDEHHICEHCGLDYTDPRALQDHKVEQHNICQHCGDRFETPSNLYHHQQVHMVRKFACPGCDSSFISNAAMVLHLEAEACPSGATMELVNKAALESDSSGDYCTSDGWSYYFNCPACNKRFRYMSAVLQHGYSARCPGSQGTSVLDDFSDFIRKLFFKFGYV